jgi:flagellar biosynthetic protein FliR
VIAATVTAGSMNGLAGAAASAVAPGVTAFLDSHAIPYLLVYVRVTGIVLLAPIFSGTEIPLTFKGLLCGAIALVIYPLVSVHLPPTSGDLLPTTMLRLLDGALIGVLIGLVLLVYYTAFLMAGEFYSLQMGFGIINVIDPLSETSIPILGQFKSLFALIVFTIINGHHMVIEALVYSFQHVPGLGLDSARPLVGALLVSMRELFLISLQIGAPIMGTVFLLELVMGVMSKVAPQMNVMVVGFQIKIVVGMTVILAFMPTMYPISQRLFDRSFHAIRGLMRALA